MFPKDPEKYLKWWNSGYNCPRHWEKVTRLNGITGLDLPDIEDKSKFGRFEFSIEKNEIIQSNE